jgi:nucleotide-binding universal stress UspA family protein
VIQPHVITSEYGAVLSNVREIVAINEQTSLAQLERHQKKLQATGLKVSIAQATGGPGALILAQAKKSRASYIVMGSHGHTALYDLLADSTATAVIKRAPCPVVIMPPEKKKKKKKKSQK